MLSNEHTTIFEDVCDEVVSAILLRKEYVNRLAVGKIRMSDIHLILRDKYNEVN